MDRQPDIVVASPHGGSVHLIVEVKLRLHDSHAVERQVKQIMVRMRSPAGLLVTLNSIRIFRDTFKDYTEDSVIEVGTVQTESIPELESFAKGLKNDPIEFEDAVRSWLEVLRYRLMQGYGRGSDGIFAEHVMPALGLGEIRSAGPRKNRVVAR